MSTCTIDAIRNSINKNAILRFRSKRVEIKVGLPEPSVLTQSTEKEDTLHVDIIETDHGAQLKKLIITASKRSLSDEHPHNGILICLDHQGEGDVLNRFTHFTNSNAAGLSSKCDFLIAIKKDNEIHIILSDLKSSKPPEADDNCRVRRQFISSKIFTDYLLNLCIATQAKDDASLNINYYNAIFLPKDCEAGILSPETLTPTAEKLKKDSYNFFEVTTTQDCEAEIGLALILDRLP